MIKYVSLLDCSYRIQLLYFKFILDDKNLLQIDSCMFKYELCVYIPEISTFTSERN